MNKIKWVKNKTFLLIISVICFTSSTMGISYSIFFQVRTNDKEQVITVGDFDVSGSEYNLDGSIVGGLIMLDDYDDIDYEEIPDKSQLEFSATNTGDMDVVFDFYTKLNDLSIDLGYVDAALFKEENGTYVRVSDIITFPEIMPAEGYKVFSSKISPNVTNNYKLKMWLSEYSPEEIISKNVNFSLDFKSDVKNSIMNYDVSGTLKDESETAISGATISIDNGSLKVVTDSNGNYLLNDLRNGTYQMKVTASDKSYSTILYVHEGPAVSVEGDFNSYTLTGAFDDKINDMNIILDEKKIVGMEFDTNE